MDSQDPNAVNDPVAAADAAAAAAAAAEADPDPSDKAGDAGDSTSEGDSVDEFDAQDAYSVLESAIASQAGALRNAGRVPDIQRALASMESRLGALDQVESLETRVRILSTALMGQLDDATRTQMQDAVAAAGHKAAVAEAAATLRKELGEPADDEDAQRTNAAAERAMDVLVAYGEGKGVDARFDIDQSVYEEAEALGNYELATAHVKRAIDRAAGKAATDGRRADKKAAGGKQVTATPATDGNAVSLASLHAASSPADIEEMSKWTPEQWDAAYAVIK